MTSPLLRPARTGRCLLCLAALVIFAHAPAADQVIPLWPEGVPGALADGGSESVKDIYVRNVREPSLTVFTPAAESGNGTAVIICPGGGYRVLTIEYEGYELARWFNVRGVTAFVLKYRLKEYGHPAPLQDVARALRLVRSRAAEFGVQPGKIGILGSSAGGHLAACSATLYDHAFARTGASLDAVSARPDFAILLYPVITMTPGSSVGGSRGNLLGADPPEELVSLYSLDRQVTPATPPTFILFTQEDQTVPVRNGVEFFTALTRHGVPAEIHIYQRGRHGIGIRDGHGPASGWPVLAEAWMQMHGFLPMDAR